jgi:hypothetical protein
MKPGNDQFIGDGIEFRFRGDLIAEAAVKKKMGGCRLFGLDNFRIRHGSFYVCVRELKPGAGRNAAYRI